MGVLITAQAHLKHMLHASLRGERPMEDITYPVICEFLYLHKIPSHRFAIYPQISLQWKPMEPKDTRAEVADFAIGNFSLALPYFKIRVGAEAKRRMPARMDTLPDPSLLEGLEDVMAEFHDAYFQGEDQAKAAMKGGKTCSNTIPYLLFVGPYWTHVTYGPFTEAQLGIRTHKQSDSDDYRQTILAARRLSAEPTRRRLYLLGTDASHIKLEEIISSTDGDFSHLQVEALDYKCE